MRTSEKSEYEMGITGGWVINIIGAIIVLFILYLVVIGLSWRIRDARKELNTVPKFFKAIGKVIGSYFIVLVGGLIVVAALSIAGLIPFPYLQYLICLFVGFLAGCIFVISRKK